MQLVLPPVFRHNVLLAGIEFSDRELYVINESGAGFLRRHDDWLKRKYSSILVLFFHP
jgi:hypothetical protein